MTLDNDKMHLCGSFAAFKSRPVELLFFALLLFGVTSLHAQEESAKKGWAVASSSAEQVGENAASTADKIAEPVNELDTSQQAPALTDSTETSNTASGQTAEQEVSQDVPIEYDISVGADPIDIPLVNVRPSTSLSPELRDSLEKQFQEIQTLRETEDAFSEQLGESYLAYGRSLMQAGRVDESRKMLVNALHITKINNGVNSIEQRPILRELFEMNFSLGNTEETEEQLKRIIWLEKKDPDNDDIYSFDMVVRLGNHYLDLYLNHPTVSELSLSHLNKSTRYLGYTVNRYGNRPLSEILLPYGELALAHHLKSRIQHEVDRSFYQDTRQRSYTDLSKLPGQHSKLSSFSRSERFLKDYLRKAKAEKDLVNTIQALLGLGDLNLMSDRSSSANKYYDLAWTGAQELPVTHPLVESFDVPVKLPSFNFSVVRRPVVSDRSFEVIPLSINIDDDGRVGRIAREALVDVNASMTNRARRIAKKVRFRPVIENGKLVPVSDYRYEVQVTVRKSKAVVAKDSAE